MRNIQKFFIKNGILLLISIIMFNSCLFTEKVNTYYKDNEKIKTVRKDYVMINSFIQTFNETNTLKFSKFSGIYTLYTLNVRQKSKIKLKYKVNTETGKLKLVLVPENINIHLNGDIEGSFSDISPIFEILDKGELSNDLYMAL